MTQPNAADDTPQNPEMEDGNTPETQGTPEPASIDPRVGELEKKLAEANDKMLRAIAEADNTRKRLEKEKQDTVKFAIASFARDLIDVADNLRRAIAAIKPDAREANAELNNIAIGVEATERVLISIFDRNGIKRIDTVGQTFDPNKHDVIFESDVTDKPAGTIIQEVESGYTIHDRLLRPAKVGVAKDGENTAEAGGKLDTNA